MSERPRGREAVNGERTLASIRSVVLALAAGPLLALSVVLLLPPPSPVRSLVTPAAIVGIVALAVGHRLYCVKLDRAAAGPHPHAAMSALRAGTITGLAVTEGAALFGVIAYHVSREPFALVGLPMHLVLTGALWPTRSRLERIRGGSPESPPRAGDP